MLYCTECAIVDGKGAVPGTFILRGRSLCYIHFWAMVHASQDDAPQPGPSVIETRADGTFR